MRSGSNAFGRAPKVIRVDPGSDPVDLGRPSAISFGLAGARVSAKIGNRMTVRDARTF